MRVLLLVVLFYFPNFLLAEELKDPWTRDEDISNTLVSVDISRDESGLYVYNYSINSNQTNLGRIDAFDIDLLCDHEFEGTALPSPAGKEGYIDITSIPDYEKLKQGSHTPVAVFADYGSAAQYGITLRNYAHWLVVLNPGERSSGLRLISNAEPGLRTFVLIPEMEPFGWDYSEEPDSSIPWIDDFTVTGMIAGPGCPGQTPPVDAAFFPGSRGQAEPDNVNALLTYSEPLLDRWHADESLKELAVTIHYADNIDPASFQVKPDWAREFFKPIPGTSQSVVLPLKQMRNRFKLMVDIDRAKVPKDFGELSQDVDAFEVRRDLTRGK